MTCFNKRNGFTLLEVIISVAALSLISVFILQMFLASSGLNERAKNTDIAITKAISEIERVKSGTSVDVGVKELSYDKNWNVLTGKNENACFLLTLTIDNASGDLYRVAVGVTDIRPGENNRVLASMETKKYAP